MNNSSIHQQHLRGYIITFKHEWKYIKYILLITEGFWGFGVIVVVGQVISHVGPIPDLSVNILHRQPGPVRHGLGGHLRLSQALLLAVEDGLQEDQLAF